MGTRADFYVGVGEKAKWIGSVAWDGYEWAENLNCDIMKSTTKDEFIINVNKMLNSRDDSIYPKDGWPWPWETSELTDYVYYFNEGKVNIDNFGRF